MDYQKDIDQTNFYLDFLINRIHNEIIKPLCDKYNMWFFQETDNISCSFYKNRIFFYINYDDSKFKFLSKEDLNKMGSLNLLINNKIGTKNLGYYLKEYNPFIK